MKNENNEKNNELEDFLKLMRGKSFEAIYDPEKYIYELEATRLRNISQNRDARLNEKLLN